MDRQKSNPIGAFLKHFITKQNQHKLMLPPCEHNIFKIRIFSLSVI